MREFEKLPNWALELCLELYVVSGICSKRFQSLLNEKLIRNGF